MPLSSNVEDIEKKKKLNYLSLYYLYMVVHSRGEISGFSLIFIIVNYKIYLNFKEQVLSAYRLEDMCTWMCFFLCLHVLATLLA